MLQLLKMREFALSVKTASKCNGDNPIANVRLIGFCVKLCANREEWIGDMFDD